MDTTPESITRYVRSLRERAGLSMAAMAKAMGYRNASSYQRYEDANAYSGGHLKRDLVAKLDRALVGKGTPAITEAEVWELAGPEFAEVRELSYVRNEDEEPETSEDYAQGYTRDHWEPKFPGALPELDISAGAGEGKIGNVIVLPLDGGGISAHEVVDEWPLPMTWLHEAVNDVSQSLVVKVVGESMVPNYLPGDRVIVDLSQDRFMNDSVYLISDGEGAPQIKRLQRVPLSVPTRVTIISDNPAYRDHEVEVDLLRIHGRVCAHVGRR
ncbi:LexA family transcriptional regulator [Pelagibacterium sp. 26DY04]|uniref:S24 family peptidase n=1 Tax=Pelagibacterium sp. 26DY04 TaxID=2967130 RepID=UPI0028156902|nr:S24 family peptidase [Pelagibacterium sp. 26DY04]WMT88251.1 LexA family transcriptional regulator [Pelagibacterium sp. 26DY04]